MKTATLELAPRSISLPAQREQRIVEAYNSARRAEADYATKALICGQLLLEHRASLASFSHNGKSSISGRNQHSGESGFSDWMESVGISKTTGYRWMDAAERVARLQLHIPAAEAFQPYLDVGGEAVPLSMALTAPEQELSAEALKFRQGVFDFMADKTISEAINAAVDGDSPASRISRAANGKVKGGAGTQDRKEFEKFTATKLRHITTFVTQKLSATQRSLITAAFVAAVELWPRWLLEAIADKCRSELKLSDPERAARTGEVK